MDSSHATREQDPFAPGADARYVYLNRDQEQLLIALVSAISNGRERLLITGGEGAGKTAFLWKLAEVLYESGKFALLGHDLVFSCHPETPVEAIETAVGEYAIGGSRGSESTLPAVLLLDDADRLDPAVLSSLWRCWPTLNETWPSMCVVMSAMPRPKQLHRRREHDVMAAEQTFVLPPMESADVEGLIRHRLRVAGLSGLELFSADALERIGYFSKRVPGRIVQLCGHIFNKSKEDALLPVSEDAVKEAAYELFLPSHLQKLARGLSLQPKPLPHGVGNAELNWNADPFISGREGHERDADALRDDALARWLGKRISVPATPPEATAVGWPPPRVGEERRSWMGGRSLASISAILLLLAAAGFVALGVQQSDRATKPEAAIAPPSPETTSPETTSPETTSPETTSPETTSNETAFAPEAVVAPSGPATARHETEPARDAGRAGDAQNLLGAPEPEEGLASRASVPPGSQPQVRPEATGVADPEQALDSPPADRSLAAVEPRRPPPLVELNSVALAQSQLNALGYAAGPVDGIVGARTRAAIRRFQADTGLPIDGRMNDALIAALRRQSTRSNLQTQGREKPRRRILPALRLQLDSVKAPEVFQEYCSENQDTWVFDRGKRKFVFCGSVLKQR